MFAWPLRHKSLPLVHQHVFRASLASSCVWPLLKHLCIVVPNVVIGAARRLKWQSGQKTEENPGAGAADVAPLSRGFQLSG